MNVFEHLTDEMSGLKLEAGSLKRLKWVVERASMPYWF